jgi:anti-sigma28 factor (negative regulator of flagellin synthesis)
MDIKVYDRNPAALQGGVSRTQDSQKTGSGSASGAQSSATGSDQVQLSGALGRLSQALSAHGTARAGRVEALTAAYRAGNYQPNAAGASKGLVAEALAGGGH